MPVPRPFNKNGISHTINVEIALLLSRLSIRWPDKRSVSVYLRDWEIPPLVHQTVTLATPKTVVVSFPFAFLLITSLSHGGKLAPNVI